MQSVLEIATPVCRTPRRRRQLRKLRGVRRRDRARAGLRVGSAGTHPFSLFERQRITARDRYRALVDQLQYVARRELIFGMHVHVAVDDPEKAIQVVNGLLPHLPQLLALSASSPFWRGEPTGLASTRQMVFAAFPARACRRASDYADYAEVVGQLEQTGCIADYTHIWWDVRPHPRLGTIEMRICDAVTRVDDAVAIAAYCQALVKLYCERYERGRGDPGVPPHPHDARTSGSPRATGSRRRSSTSRRAAATACRLAARAAHAARVEPHARELGCDRELRAIREILAAATAPTGSSASSTRTATSSRSSRRSRTRPRPRPSPRPPRPASRPSPRKRPRVPDGGEPLLQERSNPELRAVAGHQERRASRRLFVAFRGGDCARPRRRACRGASTTRSTA